MNFLYQCNDKYAPYCGISITSLFENNKDAYEINVYILDDEISLENKDKFSSLAKKYNRNINFIDTEGMTEYLDKLGVARYRGSHTTNFKIFLNKYLPKNIDRVLYIDCDTIVSGHLNELFEMNMYGKAVAMAQDSIIYKHKISIGMDKNQQYFNAGIILFDMDKWRELECEKKILNHIKNVNAYYSLPDQDLINLIIKDNIYSLEPKYNWQPAYYMYRPEPFCRVFKKSANFVDLIKTSKTDVRIYHMLRVFGKHPWDKDSNYPIEKLFDEYLKKSYWCDYIKQENKASIVYKIERALYKYMPQVLFLNIFKLVSDRK